MINAGNFEETETLKNGLTVKIRAIRPTDKAAIVDAFGKLDPESVYTRFFRAKDSLEDRELKAATEVDFENVVALVVTIESGGKEIGCWQPRRPWRHTGPARPSDGESLEKLAPDGPDPGVVCHPPSECTPTVGGWTPVSSLDPGHQPDHDRLRVAIDDRAFNRHRIGSARGPATIVSKHVDREGCRPPHREKVLVSIHDSTPTRTPSDPR